MAWATCVHKPLRMAAKASGVHSEVELLRAHSAPVVSLCEKRAHSPAAHPRLAPGVSRLGSVSQQGDRRLVWGQAAQHSSVQPAQLGASYCTSLSSTITTCKTWKIISGFFC